MTYVPIQTPLFFKTTEQVDAMRTELVALQVQYDGAEEEAARLRTLRTALRKRIKQQQTAIAEYDAAAPLHHPPVHRSST